jgi:hypothetical protein
VRTINDKAAPILIEINALCQAIEQLDAQIEQLTQTVKGRIVRPSICKALEEEIILKQRAMQARFAEIAMIENTTSNVSAMQLEAFMHQLENGLDATLTAEDFIVLGQNGAVQELKFNVLNTVQDLINKNQLFHSAFLPILQALVKANILKLVNGKPCIEIKEGPQERFEWIKANPPSFFLVNLEDFIKDSVLEFNLQAKNAVNNLTQRLIKV